MAEHGIRPPLGASVQSASTTSHMLLDTCTKPDCRLQPSPQSMGYQMAAS